MPVRQAAQLLDGQRRVVGQQLSQRVEVTDGEVTDGEVADVEYAGQIVRTCHVTER